MTRPASRSALPSCRTGLARAAALALLVTAPLLVPARPLGASMVPGTTLDDMLAGCALVFEGVVVDAGSEASPAGIHTWVCFDVRRRIEGEPPAALVLRFHGGRVGDRTEEVAGSPIPEVGTRPADRRPRAADRSGRSGAPVVRPGSQQRRRDRDPRRRPGPRDGGGPCRRLRRGARHAARGRPMTRLRGLVLVPSLGMASSLAGRAAAFEPFATPTRRPAGGYGIHASSTLGGSARGPSGLSWDAAFASAAQRWTAASPLVDVVVSQGVSESPCERGVGFAATVHGDALGSQTPAIALRSLTSGGLVVEGNIIFEGDGVVSWDVFAGPLAGRPDDGDFRRAAVRRLPVRARSSRAGRQR